MKSVYLLVSIAREKAKKWLFMYWNLLDIDNLFFAEIFCMFYNKWNFLLPRSVTLWPLWPACCRDLVVIWVRYRASAAQLVWVSLAVSLAMTMTMEQTVVISQTLEVLINPTLSSTSPLLDLSALARWRKAL